MSLVQSTISQNHISPFTSCSEKQWQLQFDSLLTDITELSREEICVRLIRIVSSLSDEHTMIFPKEEYIMPVRFKWVDEGALVYVTDSAHQFLLGTQLIALDAISAESIYAKIGALLKQDNPWYVKDIAEYFFTNTTILKGLKIISNHDQCRYTYLNHEGKRDSTILEFYKTDPKTQIDWKYANFIQSSLPYHQSANYWFEYLPNQNVLYFNFSKCYETKDYPFKRFNRAIFACINEKKPDKLIVDLRFNPGGNSRVLWPFLEAIQKSYLNTKGRLFVLIGKKVISSSLINAVQLKEKTNALLVGQPTSGNLIHFGEINQLNLKNLKCRLIYSTNKFDLMNGKVGCLAPDFSVTYGRTALLNGEDPALEFVYNYPLPE